MLRFGFTPLNLQLDDRVLAEGIFEASRNVTRFFDARDIVATDLLPVPPRRSFPQDYPLEWTDDERREYFAAVAAGRTTFPYQRTGKLFSGFDISATPIATGAMVTISNSVPYAPDVVGTFTSASPQKRYHNITGWIPLVETTPRFVERLANSMQNEIGIVLGGKDIIRI